MSLCESFGLRALEVLKTGEEHATIDRLFASKHVKDLRLIAATAVLALYVITGLLVLTLISQLQDPHQNGWRAIREFIAFFGPTLAIVAGVLSWAYQTGSARLGVIDLFACEISTLCKVAAVNDTAHSRVQQFYQGLGPAKRGGHALEGAARAFTSQESYFPVFEHDPSSLQPLEAKVVVNITEFYTFMKAVRDFMRVLAAVDPQESDREKWPGDGAPLGPWREAARNVIYMLFLGMESARKAIAHLVEFSPERAERTIIVLLSELEAYRFLCEQYKAREDPHAERIRLRRAGYVTEVPKVYDEVIAGLDAEPDQWRPAEALLPELAKRYKEAVHHALKAPPRSSAPRGLGQKAARPVAPLVGA